MKITVSPAVEKAIKFLFICLTSVYLTFLVDIYTLNTTLKKMFVFGYFVVMCTLFMYLKNRLLKVTSKKTISPLYTAVILVFSISVLAVFQDTFLPLVRSNVVTLRAEGNGEVWLVEAEADGKSIPLSQLSTEEKYNWEYNADYDDYVYYPGEETEDNGLSIEIAGQDIKLKFGANSWSGSVVVSNSEGNTETLELYSEGKGACEYLDRGVRQYTIFERVLLNLGALVLLVCAFDLIVTIVLRSKKTEGPTIRTHSDRVFLIAGTLLSIVTIAVFVPQLCFEGEDFDVTITSLDDRNPNCEGYEMGFSLTANGMSVAPESNDNRWVKFGDGYLCTAPNQAITFKLNSLDENVIYFGYHKYAAIVRVDYLDNTEIIDLYSENERVEKCTLNQEYALINPLEILFRAIVIGVVFLTLSLLVAQFRNNIRMSISLCLSIFFLILFSGSAQHQYQYYVFFAVSLFGSWHIYRNGGKYIQDYFKEKSTVVAVCCVSFYMAFALFGFDLFLSGVFWDLHVKNIVSYLYLAAMSFPIVLLCLEGMERAKETILKKKICEHKEKECREFRIKAFFVLAIPMIISCIIFYPANMTSDQVDQWIQALGYIPIADAHPAIHTIFLRLCSKIYPSPVTVTIIQALLLAFVISSILNKCYRKGISTRILLGIAALFSVLPNTIAMITSITKNIMFAILLLWTIYLLMEAFDDPVHFFKSPIYIIQSLIVLPFVHMVRHNAFVILPIVALVLIYCTVKYFKEVHARPILLLIGMILIIYLVKGPVYCYFDVVNSGSSKILPPLTPFSVALKYDVPLSDDMIVFLEKILPKEEYAKRYSPYNSDVFDFSEPRPDSSKVTTVEGLNYYLKFLFQRPDIVIKERLDGTNIIWDVFSHPGVRHDRCVCGIWGAYSLIDYMENEPQTFIPERKVEDVVYRAGSGCATDTVARYISMFNESAFLNSFIWRNGLYLILMLIVGVFALRQKMYRVLVLESIPFTVICTILLVFGCQIYQYVWFFPMCICMICLYALICERARKNWEANP